ncbi:YcaO-like family protein [Roseobacter sp.]|uniref:YcaO-like family protein n=1 Tax=Roseobacter sp. TaxID=1907202 RepID=UPI0038597E79
MDFKDSPEKQLLNGSHRVSTIDATLKRILPLKHSFGITRIANVTGLDRVSVPVAIAVRPNARSIAISQGKGATYDHAKASALMEAIEIWHAEHFEGEVYYASAADLLAKHQMIDLSRLPRTPGPDPKATVRMHWVKATDLMNDTQKLVPLEMVHADYTHPLSSDCGYFPASTNGLASGNHLLEATCHAICEVVERDALSVWHHLPSESQRATRLDPASVTDPTHIATLEKFANAGLECALWDVTSDIGVPTVLCIIYETDAPDGHLGLGSGSHLDTNTALHRAMNEAAQTRLNYITGAREDLFHNEYTTEGRQQKIDAFAALLDGREGLRKISDIEGVVNQTLEADLDWLKAKLREAGIEEIALVNLTREEFDIPVVRAIIPGLEAPHDDEAYIKGTRATRAMSGEIE